MLAGAMCVLASHRVTVAGGERQVAYRTDMESVSVEKETANFIAAHVDSLTRQGVSLELRGAVPRQASASGTV